MPGIRRRTRLFIARNFQIRYISLILLLMFIVVLLSGYTVYVTTWIIFGEKLAAVYPQGLLIDIIKQVNAVLLLRLLFLMPLVFLIGLVLSNRIAGPMYRIKKYLARISSGQYDEDLVLREKDELKDIAEAVNVLVGKLRSAREKRLKRTEEIKESLGAISAELSSGNVNPANISSRLEEIHRKVDKLLK